MQQMIFIADLVACSTCFGHRYVHHQELESIIQVVAACGIWCFGFHVVGSGNHCCRGKATSITYSECVFVALVIHHSTAAARRPDT